MRRSCRFLSLLLLPITYTFILVFPASAQIQVVVEGNGSGSSTDVSVDNSQETTVEQSNTASVNNDISQSANTGSNTSSGNNSEQTSVTTGDVNLETTVLNSVNHSSVSVDLCCQGGAQVTVSGNGTNSTNSVQFSQNKSTAVNVSQNAQLINNIGLTGTTGQNSANANHGRVSLSTGDITGNLDLRTIANLTRVVVGAGSDDVTIRIHNNGADSVNTILFNLLSGIDITKHDQVTITTNIYSDLLTGGNHANNNLGEVLLTTGDISFDMGIVNGPINVNDVAVLCCDDGEPVTPDPPKPGDNPSVPPPVGGQNPGNGGHANGGNGGRTESVGQVLAAVTDMLPSTGASAFHFWIMLVVYLLTFLSGLYLRLRAGRSPNFRGAYILPT